MVGAAKAKRITEAIPNYPGREQAERAIRPLVVFVAGKWIRHDAERQAVRLVGFHAMWHELRRQGVKKPARELELRGAMKGRTIYDCRRDFELIFGVDVDEATAEQVLRAAVGSPPEAAQ